MLALGQDNICTVVLACFASGIANFFDYIMLNSIAPDLNFTFTNIFQSHHKFFLIGSKGKGYKWICWMDMLYVTLLIRHTTMYFYSEKCFSE